MWTTNPTLASLLANPEDGYKYMQSSGKKVDWKCPNCENIINNKIINKIKTNGLSCPKCSDKISSGERLMYNILSKLNIEFLHDKSMFWSENKRYDFYLPLHNTIIEMHGKQHYNGGFESYGGNSLTKEIENDNFKYKMAIDNGISNYVVINSSDSNLLKIAEEIKNSKLYKLLDLKSIDIEEVLLSSTNSKLIECCNLYKSNEYNLSDISKILKVSRNTVTSYLKKGASYGFVEYDVKESYSKKTKNSVNKTRKPILQYDRLGNLIKEWYTQNELKRALKVSSPTIVKYCNSGELWLDCYWKYK